MSTVVVSNRLAYTLQGTYIFVKMQISAMAMSRVSLERPWYSAIIIVAINSRRYRYYENAHQTVPGTSTNS